MVLCALAGLSASLRSAANLPAATHETSFFVRHCQNLRIFSCANGF
jgi:hypothetical protein